MRHLLCIEFVSKCLLLNFPIREKLLIAEFLKTFNTQLRSIKKGKIMLKKFILICLILTSKVFATNTLNFDELPRGQETSDRFTILSLDSSLIPNTKLSIYNNQKVWYKKFINPNLLTDKTVWNEEPKKETNAIVVTKNIKGEKPYIVISLKRKKKTTGAENITALAMGNSPLDLKDTFVYSASMIIFYDPKNSNIVHPYVWGKWNGLINNCCIVPDWGLRLITSQEVYNSKIKELKRRDYRHSNPASRTEKRDQLAPLYQFKIDVGSEGIESLKALTKFSKRHTYKGDDIFQFTLSKVADLQEENPTLVTLGTIHTFISQMNQEIHKEFRPYVDQIIKDRELIKKLEVKAAKFFLGEIKNLSMFFVHQNLWKAYGKSPSFSLHPKEKWAKHPLKALENKEIKFKNTLYIKKYRHKEVPFEETIGRYLFSLPFEYNNVFYRFDRNRWFKVDESRFGIIGEILRKYKVSPDELGLPDYTEELLENQKGKYQEDKYNKASVIEMNKLKNSKALLLDRKNINFKGKGNKFEFADILLNKGESIYLIHVKRAKANQLSHLREQIERCAEYLGSNLDRSKDKEIIKDKNFDKIKNLLFSNGVLDQKTSKQLTLVLAMIDDKQSKKPLPLFKKQDLWGLDRTRQLVKQYGFSFAITVINEKKLEGKDIFGSPYITAKHEQVDSTLEQVDEWVALRNEIKKYAVEKKFVFGKKAKKAGQVNISKLTKAIDKVLKTNDLKTPTLSKFLNGTGKSITVKNAWEKFKKNNL